MLKTFDPTELTQTPINYLLLELQLLKLQKLASEKKGTPIGETIGKKIYHKSITKNIEKKT